MIEGAIYRLGILSAMLGLSLSASPALSEESYQKVSESKDVVKEKLYPKNGRIELNIPDVGLIMNQSYINTILLHAGINYFPNENWGFGVEGAYGINSDKSERACIESFYLDPTNGNIAAPCGSEGDPGSDLGGANGGKYGPAYVPIREINYLLMGNFVWTPVYGKQLFMLSATSYFDLFFTIGGGVAMSDYYPKQDVLRNGNKARGDAVNGQIPSTIGADANDTSSIGVDGRPTPQAETTPLLNLGIGQRYHFMKRFNVKIELRNFTLLGTESGFENLLAIWTGLGMRF